MDARYAELKERLAEIVDLGKASALLGWDQQVKMPPRGAAGRAEQLATLGKIVHERFTDPAVGRLLDDLQGFEESQPYDSVEASLVRVARRDWEKARRVPVELRVELTRAAALAYSVWVEARASSDFSLFLPHVEKQFELRRRYLECFDDFDEPYDVLLDDFEPGMKTAEVRNVFERLKAEQIPLVAAVAERGNEIEGPRGPFDVEAQKRFELDVISRFGYDPSAWRIDETVHPFASGTNRNDIRITTRHFEDSIDGLFACMHEFGHGLYEHQVGEELERTPLCRGVSLALHESQSRMWENLVGRSLPFWRCFFPRLQQAFPAALAGWELDEWYRYVNRVEPSLIRVEADEATYNLHIVLRFELEQELLAGDVRPRDLPEIWNARMRDYLGVEVPDDRRGVLQDMHWSGGHIGYFSTYALGNVVAAQLWERIRDDLPGLDDELERGEFGSLRGWLGERLHRHGRKFTPAETLERVAGGPIDPEPYLRYLREKLGGIHGLAQTSSR
ncbi:MAG TPA: carboxypeptidase M32 [Gaiellaceae bacterium]|nr:carboxypeptidase M32 [Gaiellaceae bacterium]